LRVLVVDDVAANRQILYENLSRWGMAPVAVSSVVGYFEIRSG